MFLNNIDDIQIDKQTSAGEKHITSLLEISNITCTKCVLLIQKINHLKTYYEANLVTTVDAL